MDLTDHGTRSHEYTKQDQVPVESHLQNGRNISEHCPFLAVAGGGGGRGIDELPRAESAAIRGTLENLRLLDGTLERSAAEMGTVKWSERRSGIEPETL
jgi:hypothetical protein